MESEIVLNFIFKGVSAPGGDFLHAPKLEGNINKLIKQCSSIPICVGKVSAFFFSFYERCQNMG